MLAPRLRPLRRCGPAVAQTTQQRKHLDRGEPLGKTGRFRIQQLTVALEPDDLGLENPLLQPRNLLTNAAADPLRTEVDDVAPTLRFVPHDRYRRIVLRQVDPVGRGFRLQRLGRQVCVARCRIEIIEEPLQFTRSEAFGLAHGNGHHTPVLHAQCSHPRVSTCATRQLFAHAGCKPQHMCMLPQAERHHRASHVAKNAGLADEFERLRTQIDQLLPARPQPAPLQVRRQNPVVLGDGEQAIDQRHCGAVDLPAQRQARSEQAWPETSADVLCAYPQQREQFLALRHSERAVTRRGFVVPQGSEVRNRVVIRLAVQPGQRGFVGCGELIGL